MRVLFVGDIVGEIGRKTFAECLNSVQRDYSPQIIIVNGENSASGKGITEDIYKWFLKKGVQVVTLGNHAWAKKDIFDFIDEAKYLIRPANFSMHAPGKGVAYVKWNKFEIAVINLQGRVFMGECDDPFAVAESLVVEVRKRTPFIIIDFHGETTSEKQAFGWFVDGQVSAVLGTHTHVQTADNRIMPKGTAYITDVGMTGSYDSVIGVDKDAVVERFRTQLPKRFVVPKSGRTLFSAVLVEINEQTGLATKIERIQRC